MLDAPVLRTRGSKVTTKEKNILMYGNQGGELAGNGVENHLSFLGPWLDGLPAAFFALPFRVGLLVGDYGKSGKAYGQ